MDPIENHTLTTRVEKVSKRCMDLALDAIGRDFGEQGRVSDSTNARDIQRDGPDLMSDIECLHLLLGE